MINLSSNLAYSIVTATSLLSSTPALNPNNLDIQLSINSSYQGDCYSFVPNTSAQYTSLNITQDMLLNNEIEKFKQLILDEFDTKVVDVWAPLNNTDEKTCLFVRCDIQDEMGGDFEKLSKFELDLYLTLQEALEDSDFFNMIAIL